MTMSPEHRNGVCPDCGTPLVEQNARQRGHRWILWCDKCEREVGRDLMAALEKSLREARS